MTAPKPTATATITPIGPRDALPRDHLIEVVIKLGEGTTPSADKGYLAGAVRQSFASFPTASRARLDDISVSSKGKQNRSVNVMIGVEGSTVCQGRPENDAVERLRAVFLDAGYLAVVREKRECTEPACALDAMVDWDRPDKVPSGWYSNLICGRHNYRQCPQCNSVYVLTSTGAPGQAPAVHCEVCGVVMFEWGSTKLWQAELITRGKALG